MNTKSTPSSQSMLSLLPVLLAGLIGLSSTACGREYDQVEPRLTNGPMIGVVTPDTITIWARVTGDYTFSVLNDTDPEMLTPSRSELVNGVTSWPEKINAEEREKREKGLYLEYEP